MGSLCSARLLRPLLRFPAAAGAVLDSLPTELMAAAPDDRVPVDLLHSTFDRAAERLGDPQLGLKLGRGIGLGELGPIDYLLHSAPSARDGLEAAVRYSRLQGDTYRVGWERYRDGGLLRLHDETAWSRTVADLSMGVAYKLHVGARAPFVSRMECWFPYASPADLDEYERCFPRATLRFGAPFHAFAFDDSYGVAPQSAAEPALHALLRDRLDGALKDLGRVSSLRHRVRKAIEHQIRNSDQVTASAVARTLRTSERTLSRKLGQEGSRFSDELDRVRQQLARTYVCESERPFAEIAYLLRFSHVESFYRAFKRWTGTTPLAQRTGSARGLAVVDPAQ